MAKYAVETYDSFNEDFAERNELLDEVLPKMKWEPSEVVLDVGSGPGTITKTFLWQKLQKKNVSKLIGMDCDINMVKYAQDFHSDESISFIQANVENIRSIPKEYEKTFSKAFSFFVLQDVCSIRNALNNLNWLMKSDGEVCMLLASSIRLTEAQISVFNLPEFSDLLTNQNVHICCQNEIFSSPNVEPGFRNLLSQCGFEVYVCRVEDSFRMHENAETYMDYMNAIDANFGSIPKSMQSTYREEMYKHFVKSHQLDVNGQKTEVVGKDGTHMHYKKILKIHAIKKKHIKVK